jgi:hypothetical protein
VNRFRSVHWGEWTRCPPTYSSSKKDKREAVAADGRGGAAPEGFVHGSTGSVVGPDEGSAGFNGGSEDEPSSTSVATDEIIYPVVSIAGEAV